MHKLLNSVVENDFERICEEDKNLPKNLSGLRQSLVTAPDKLSKLYNFTSTSIQAALSFVSKKSDHEAFTKSYESKMTQELHKRGVCEILEESLLEMKRTLELTTERPLKKSDLKISVLF